MSTGEQYQEWFESVERDGLHLTPEEAFALLDLVEIIEDACAAVCNLLERQQLSPFGEELRRRREMWRFVPRSKSTNQAGSEGSCSSQAID
jgi:hypothetical protein